MRDLQSKPIPLGKLYGVQTLRLVAATMVLIGHLLHETYDLGLASGSPPALYNIIWWPAGVDIFFIISGFMMLHIAGATFGSSGAAKAFMLRRIIRVVPLYWLFTSAMLLSIVLFPNSIHFGQPSLSQIAGSLLFIPVADPYGHHYPVLILGWTLNFEMLFYVVFASALALTFRKGIASIALVLALLGFAWLLPRELPGPLAFWADPIVFEFLGGMAIAGVRRRGIRLRSATAWSISASGFALLILSHALHPANDGGFSRLLWIGVPALLCCLGPALTKEQKKEELGIFSRGLCLGGDASFCLYLSHPFLTNMTAQLLFKAPNSSPVMFAIVAGFASLAFAIAFHVVVERRATRWLLALALRPSGTVLAPVTGRIGA